MSVHRVMRRTPATITWQPTDQAGEPVAATGTPTVAVTRADGTTVTVPSPTITGGVVSLALSATVLADLDQFTVEWSLDAAARGETTIDIVGGRIASLAELRARQAPHLDVAVVNNATLAMRRDEVEAWFERTCSRAFTPRFDVYWHPAGGSGSITLLPHPDVRRIRWARSVSSGVVATLAVDAVDIDSVLGGVSSSWGRGTAVEIGYEHGLDEPPDDIVSAAAIAVRLAVASPRIRVDQFGQPVEGFSDRFSPDPDTNTLSNTLKRWQADPVMVA